jgi:PAS domain S-box-containing protein
LAEEPDKRILNLLRSQMIEEMSGRLSMGQPFVFQTKDMNRKRQEMLETLGIRSGVIIPMFIESQWWGSLGLEQCFIDRDWPQSEIDGLNRAEQVLGTLIASVRVEQQFRQLKGNIQAVFWISDPDGRTKQYVSPGYEEIWGRTCVNLQRNPQSWLQAIHPEDQSRVSEALVKQVWGEYDEEFRVQRPDGSIRWAHDRAFPVRDQSGKVSRIVGIAADITKEKQVEEQLRAATVMLSSLINNLRSGVMVEDEARRITHVNAVFNKTFNVPVPTQSLLGVDSRLLFPKDFLGIAESTDLLLTLERWVLTESCLTVAGWHHRNNSRATLNVNLCPKHYATPDLPGELRDALSVSGLDPRCLRLEITESALMESSDSISTTLAQIQAMNIQLHMDDFGTGYSSLSYLNNYPIDSLKVGQSFVGKLGLSEETWKIVQVIVSLGKSLDMELIAEGIENMVQLRMLQTLKCNYGQGYYFAKPMAPADIESMLSGPLPWMVAFENQNVRPFPLVAAQ